MKKLIYSIGGILFLFVFVRFIPLVFIGQAPICDKDLTKSNLSEYNQNEELAVLQLLNESRAEDFRYFFESFVEEKGKNYMITNFRNESYCFSVKLLVNKWNRLAGMKKVNGKSYPKELRNLKWTLEDVEGSKEVVYVDMARIID